LFGLEIELIDIMENLNWFIIDDVVDFLLKMESCVKSFGTKSLAQSSSLDDSSITHLYGQWSQFSGHFFAKFG
jgi:hypothetical protein